MYDCGGTVPLNRLGTTPRCQAHEPREWLSVYVCVSVLMRRKKNHQLQAEAPVASDSRALVKGQLLRGARKRKRGRILKIPPPPRGALGLFVRPQAASWGRPIKCEGIAEISRWSEPQLPLLPETCQCEEGEFALWSVTRGWWWIPEMVGSARITCHTVGCVQECWIG